MRRTCLHVYPSDFTHETRIQKITKGLLAADCVSAVDIAALHREGLPMLETLDDGRVVWRTKLLSRSLNGQSGKLLQIVEWTIRILCRYWRHPPSVVHARTVSVLPLGVAMKILRGTRLVYDVHELETETMGCTGTRQRMTRWLEGRLIKQADAVVVVNESIAAWYRDTYGLKNVDFVRNIPDYSHVDAQRPPDPFPFTGDGISFLYQGLVDPGRGIETLLDVFRSSPRDRHLVILGNGSLASDVMQAAREHENIHYLPEVRLDELPSITSRAHVGLALIEPRCLSYYLSLPNKLFEYVKCGIPVLASPMPEMARIIEAHNCGWIAPVDVTTVRETIMSISRDDVHLRSLAAREAAKTFQWSDEMQVFREIYNRLGLHSAS